MTKHPLLVPDLDALRRKLADPPPLLARLYARFRARLDGDAAFRRDHVFLPALLGEPAAVAEARRRIVELATDPLLLAAGQSPSSTASAQESLDHHIWCVAPRAMRLAVYFTWLDVQAVWTPGERVRVATAVLDFFETLVTPVLRARIPAGHNQQLSMTFCSAVAGHVFADVDAMASRARALRDWALPKFRQTLGLMPGSGYSGEGSTYQSDVVSPLVMWAGVLLQQRGEADAWHRRWKPNGACLGDTLKMEVAMGSCGGLLPPWDHYGWSRIHNLAARALWADLTRNPALLTVAETAWDEESFIAWRPDDRLWTLVYWPELEGEDVPGVRRQVPGQAGPTPDPRHLKPVLTGWSLPAVGAAIEHRQLRLRALCVWDRCAGSPQGICRGQVNPNHLILDFAGEPVTADGWEDGRVRLVSDAAMARTLSTLSPAEQALIAQQYGSLDTWIRNAQHGFLGQSCAIVVDGWESYFPREAREGRLVFEQRGAERHTVAGESAAYYQPALDVTRMRRTVSMNADGVIWVVDDVRAATAHVFTWRLWLRRGAHATPARTVRLDLASGPSVALAWWIATDGVEVPAVPQPATFPAFPQRRGAHCPWPDEGSDRCDLTASGRSVRFVTCLVPAGADRLQVRQVAPGVWQASWDGGQDVFVQPPEIDVVADDTPARQAPAETHTACDLDEAPFGLLDEPDAALLRTLDDAPPSAWRRTGGAMQALTVRGCAAALAKIEALLKDARQNYTVHAVAAWCLGHARYAPALETLERMSGSPEDNTAARARWAVERLVRGSGVPEQGAPDDTTPGRRMEP